MNTVDSSRSNIDVNTSPSLKKMDPTKTLLIRSMPCEVITAVIRNKTVDSMQSNNIADVAYRFLQSRQGESNTFREAILWGTQGTVMCAVAHHSPNCPRLLKLSAIGFSALNMLPNINNSRNYRETKKHCKNWLIQKLGQQKFEEIEKIKFNQNGLLKLIHLLKEQKINTMDLELK